MKKVLAMMLTLVLALTVLPVLADMDDSFTLKLKGNPSTGYEWTYTIENEAVLSVTNDGYVSDDTTGMLIGAGGEYTFTFRGLRDGYTTVTFTYARPFASDEAPLCTVVYQVSTDDDGDVQVFICQINPGL